MMNYLLPALLLVFTYTHTANAQMVSLQDNFESTTSIIKWVEDNCQLEAGITNPFQTASNSSARVLKYHDTGGQYANIRFDLDNNFDLSDHQTFTLKIYVPSNGLTGNQPNQISLKLQNGMLQEPWSTQSEIIKPIVLDQWQTLSFDFKNDSYINLNADSGPPIQREDFNRVLIQINGENNFDQVLAYIDDFNYDGTILRDPVYDQLVWSDEFEEDGPINPSNWFHQTQLPAGGSWFNGEIQHYTNRLDNSFVEDGLLKIVAKRENFNDQGHTKEFTSARLNSKFAFTYGRVEIRAKLPSGVGTWPALWMLGKNINEDGAFWDNQGFGTTGWPACGEIDIMEHWGNNQNYVQSATHTPSSFGATENHGGQIISTASTDFHVYALKWTPEKLVFSVDDVVHYTYQPEVKDANTWPFDADQYFIFNIAIQPIITPSFSQSAMEVDYIRVYQESTVTSVDEVENLATKIYPNPISNELTISLPEIASQDVTLRLFSIDGKLINTYTRPIINNEISLTNLSYLKDGVYLLEFVLEGKQQKVKFVKK